MQEPESGTPVLFDIVASGRPLADRDPAEVRARLEAGLRLPAATAARLLGGSPVVLKRSLAAPQAEAYCTTLRAAGLDVAARPRTAPESPCVPRPADAPAATAASATTAAVAEPTPAPIVIPRPLQLWPQTLQLLVAPLLYGLLCLLALVAVVAFGSYALPRLLEPPVFFSLPVGLLPLLVGVLVLAMLVRPLWRRAPAPATVVLDPGAEPGIDALLDTLCDRLGAARPARIAIDLGSDVGIDLLPGRDGWQRGRYELHIGLPLLLNAAPEVLAAALAAELVCARDRGQLRLRVLVARVRSWLNCNAEPGADALSTHLGRIRQTGLQRALLRSDDQVRRVLAGGFAGLAQRASRAAERTLLALGDRAATAVGGADAVADSLQTIARLDHARARALQKNREQRVDRRPVDDLAALIGFFYDHPDPAFDQQRTRALETGAAVSAGCGVDDRTRIARAAQWADAVPVPVDRVALADAHALGCAATEAFYARQAVHGSARMPAEIMLEDALLDLEQAEAGARYFHEWLVPDRNWSLPDVELLRAMPAGDAREQLNVCVNEVRRLAPDRARLLADYRQLQARLGELLLGQQVLAARQPFQFRYIKYDGTSLAPLIEQCQAELADIGAKLATQESIMGGRIALGLKLFGQDGSEAEALHRTLAFIGDQNKLLQRLDQDTVLLEQLLQRSVRERGHDDAIARLVERVRDTAQRLIDKLETAPAPADRRYAPLRACFDDRIDAIGRGPDTAAARARALLEGFQMLHCRLSLLAAEQASSVEEAYRIEQIRRVS